MTTSSVLRRTGGSVRVRVTLLAAGAFAIVLIVAALTLLHALERVLIDDLRSADREALERQAVTVATEGVPVGADVVTSAIGEVVNLDLVNGHPIVMVVPSDVADDSAMSDGTEGPTDEWASTDFVETLPVASAQQLGIVGPPEQYAVTSMAYGGFTLATASPLEGVRETIATTRNLLWLLGPALVALVAGIAWFLAGRALRPVHAVTSHVAAIGSNSLHERVPVPSSSDEIAELARTMNDMLGRLEVATTSSRRLVSDASHELRTPVTVMRTELEIAGRTTDPDWAATSGVLLGELTRLQELVDDLLLLARGDERAFAKADVSIGDVAHEVAARRRRVPVEVRLDEGDHVVQGDETALRRAIDHVVSNAARHADARVIVEVGSDHDTVSVHVDDDGAGIPSSDRDKVVRRFVRLDASRGRAGGGAGLGLAVTSDVVAAHGGRVVIGDAPIGGARFALLLPRRWGALESVGGVTVTPAEG